MPESRNDLEVKLARVRDLLRARAAEAALFTTHASFAWLTGGARGFVGTATDRSAAGILVTEDAAWLIADNIEMRRLLEEECPGLDLLPREFHWWAGSILEEARLVLRSGRLLSDLPAGGADPIHPSEMIGLRNPLLPSEVDRYRELGEHVAIVLTHVAFHCRPGLPERQLAGMLAKGLLDFGILPAALLVAADDRAFEWRHPLPTGRRLERYALFAVGGRRYGLNLSATRPVHFGRVPAELARRHAACAAVDAAFLAATVPGRPLAAVFRAGQDAYASAGYPDEWRNHHQGGPTGYEGRDWKVTPDTPGEVAACQAFAWNPTIAGVKSEDTVLASASGIEVLSATPDLPVILVEAGGRCFARPAILER